MGYMVRLGLWGEGSPAFQDFGRFLKEVTGSKGAGMAVLELVAMEMKAQGMYVCRTLSFTGRAGSGWAGLGWAGVWVGRRQACCAVRWDGAHTPPTACSSLRLAGLT